MIKIIEGNLLDAQATIIAHQVNCKGIMNGGVAKSIRNKYPIVFEKYSERCLQTISLLGTTQFVKIDENRYVANLFSQNNYGYDGNKYTSYEALEKCFLSLKHKMDKIGDNCTVAFPYKIACVRGGADWEVVCQMINKIFADYSVELWKLDLG